MSVQQNEQSMRPGPDVTGSAGNVRMFAQPEHLYFFPLDFPRDGWPQAASVMVVAMAAARKPAPDRAQGYKVRMQLRNFTIPEVATAFSEIQLVAPDTVEARVLRPLVSAGIIALKRISTSV